MALPKANKSFGQHFLKDQSVIQKITTDYASECDSIVEIGPGPNILTKHLAAHGKPLAAIEMDTRFKDVLLESVEERLLYFEDALNFDWNKLPSEFNNIWLVSNLPYNVSSLLFLSFLRIPKIKYMSLMFQKEVGEKTVIQPGKKSKMNSLLAQGLCHFDSKSLCKVSPGAFLPPPKVDSVVVSYKRLQAPLLLSEQLNQYEAFLRKLFQNPRKQMHSNLKEFLTKELLTENGFNPQARAEVLTIEQILSLFKLTLDRDKTPL